MTKLNAKTNNISEITRNYALEGVHFTCPLSQHLGFSCLFEFQKNQVNNVATRFRFRL